MMVKAIFLGWQEDGQGGAFPLFDMVTEHGGYPNGSTVGLESVIRFGAEVPEYPEWEGAKK